MVQHTLSDDGSPSNDPFNDLQRCLLLAKDERYLVAHDLYENAKARIEVLRKELNMSKEKNGKSWTKTKADHRIDILDKAEKLMSERAKDLESLWEIAGIFRDAEENLNEDANWIYSHTFLGISTSYRHEFDGSVTVKMEGETEGVPIFEQLAVVRESDLFNTWAPFCTKSRVIARLDRTDNVSWFLTSFPFLTRDCLYRGKGCDCMMEAGKILIASEGVEDTIEKKKKKGGET